MILTFFEARYTDQHGHAAAIFPYVLLLERLHAPLLRDPPLLVAVAPFRRCKVSPAQTARDEILTVVSHDAEKCVIALQNPTSTLPDDDPDDVGVDQASYLRFAFAEIAVQTRIFQRDCRLRGEQLQYRDPGWREDPGGQVVLKVEDADEIALID